MYFKSKSSLANLHTCRWAFQINKNHLVLKSCHLTALFYFVPLGQLLWFCMTLALVVVQQFLLGGCILFHNIVSSTRTEFSSPQINMRAKSVNVRLVVPAALAAKISTILQLTSATTDGKDALMFDLIVVIFMFALFQSPEGICWVVDI